MSSERSIYEQVFKRYMKSLTRSMPLRIFCWNNLFADFSLGIVLESRNTALILWPPLRCHVPSFLLIFSGYITLSLPLSFPISIHLSGLCSSTPLSVFHFCPLPLTSSCLSPVVAKFTLFSSSSSHSLPVGLYLYLSSSIPVSLLPSLPSASTHIQLWTFKVSCSCLSQPISHI